MVSSSEVEWATGLNNGRKIVVENSGIFGKPHIVFQSEFHESKTDMCEITYACKDVYSGEWLLEPMEGLFYPSIALSSDGRPYLIYVGWGRGDEFDGEFVDVIYKDQNGEWYDDIGWVDFFPRFEPDHFFDPSIALDGLDRWHAVWICNDEQTNISEVRYANQTMVRGTYEVVGGTWSAGAVKCASIAIDEDDEGIHPNILYEVYDMVWHYRLEDGLWVWHMVEQDGWRNHPCIDLKEYGWQNKTIWGVYEDNDGYNDIEFGRYHDPNWIDALQKDHIFESAAPSTYPVIDDGYVLWAEELPKTHVYYSRARYIDGDWEWSPPDVLSNTRVHSRFPQIAYYDASHSWLAWAYTLWTRQFAPGQYYVICGVVTIIPELPYIDEDLGQFTDSPSLNYRDGYISYGDLQCEDIDYGYSNLGYLIEDLDSSATYWLEISAYHEAEDTVVQSVVVEGDTLADQTLAPYEPEYIVADVPSAALADGAIELTILKDEGEFAVAGILRLYEEGGGERGRGMGGSRKDGPQVAILGGSVSSSSISLTAAPNPFRSSATIQVDVPHQAQISVGIYDLTGRLVRSLADGCLPEGKHSFVWEGDDVSGAKVPSGIYICRVNHGKEITASKLVIAR